MNNINLEYLHIGHHKCASSYIQYHIIPSIKHLKQPQFDRGGKILNKAIFNYIIEESDIYFKINDDIKKYVNYLKSNNINCISYEGFTGYHDCLNGSIFRYLPERLCKIFNPKKLLIIIRNQKDILLSWYLDDIKYGYSINFNDWFKYICQTKKINKIKYHFMIEKYVNLLGINKLKVIQFEDLFNDNSSELFKFFDTNLDDYEFFKKNKKQYENKRLNSSINTNNYRMFKFVNSISTGKNNIKPGILYKVAKKIHFNEILPGKRINYEFLKINLKELNLILDDLFKHDNIKVSELINQDLNYKYNFVDS